MKKISTMFLQVVIVLIGIGALAIMVRFPLIEGRAASLDLFSIYTDPFIVFGYLASIPFFVALYQAFKLLGYFGQNKVFSLNSVKALRAIKYCAIILSFLIVIAAIYIRVSYGTSPTEDDDPAGFIAISTVAIFISVVVATAAALFEKALHSAVELKSENDLTV
jgi:hypothetical protein